jgi:ATP-binding cassette subfamily A (ABC1) protein 3
MCFEIVLPALIILGFSQLAGISSFQSLVAPEGWSYQSGSEFTTAPFAQPMRGSTSNTGTMQGPDGGSWARVATVNSYLARDYQHGSRYPGFNLSHCNKIAVVSASGSTADQARIKTFVTTVNDLWHPGFNSSTSTLIPGFAQSVIMFSDEAEMADYISGADYAVGSTTMDSTQCDACTQLSISCHPTIGSAIVFKSLGDAMGGAGPWDYVIRLNSTGNYEKALNTRTPPVDTLTKSIDNTASNGAASSGFMSLQMLVDRYILDSQLDPSHTLSAAKKEEMVKLAYSAPIGQQGSNFSFDYVQAAGTDYLVKELMYTPSTINLITMPTENFSLQLFFNVAGFIFPLLFVLATTMSVFLASANILGEKETKTREMLRVMGVSNGALMGSWYVMYGQIYFAMALLAAFISRGLFPNSAFGLLFLFFYIFFLSFLSLAYFLSAFFSKAKVGSVVCTVFYFAGWFLSLLANSASATASSKAAICLLPAASFALGIKQIVNYESNGVGITPVTAGQSVNGFSFTTSIGMLFVDIFLYAFLGWYFDQVLVHTPSTLQRTL